MDSFALKKLILRMSYRSRLLSWLCGLVYFTNKKRKYSRYNIGDFTYGDPEVYSWGEEATLTIGRFCSIAFGVKILLGGEHRADLVTSYPLNVVTEAAHDYPGGSVSKGDVLIGNDVFIGAEAMILSGVCIGDGAVIGARSIVTKDVAPYAVVAGNPARQIKLRFNEGQIKSLLEIAWWDWPAEKIEGDCQYLLSQDVDLFIEKHK